MTRLFGHKHCENCGEAYGSFSYNGGPIRIKEGLCTKCTIKEALDEQNDAD